MTEARNNPELRTWLPIPVGSDFPVQNLPFGIFRTNGAAARVGVAIGDQVIDMAALDNAGLFTSSGLPDGLFAQDSLNAYLEAGPPVWTTVRKAVSDLLTSVGPPVSPRPSSFLTPMNEAQMLLPVEIGDYVDFYSSLEHARNVGLMFRPDDPPLLPNWRHLPVGYHGRSSSIVVGGTAIKRPIGQYSTAGGGPVVGPTRRLDIELEVGFITGPGNRQGSPIDIADAETHIFGLVLVNDWSARDIQAWEYQPLGPFLGKSFATSISPWVVPLQALGPYRVPAPVQDPSPSAYLTSEPRLAIDLNLTVDLNRSIIARSNFKNMYWTMAQQLAHATVNGTNIRPGDLYASGTVSGSDPGSLGSLLELSWNGTRQIKLGDGESRTFLEDGDEVTIRGWCGGSGSPRVGFGTCAGKITPGEA